MKTVFLRDAIGDYAYLLVGEVLDYAHDWTDFLAASGNDTIQSSTWTLGSGLTASSPGVAGAKTFVFLAGAASGTTYWADNMITTTGGRTKKESFRLIGRTR